jgi:hypothetical protein
VSAWTKIDDLRDRVMTSALIEVDSAECPTPASAMATLYKKGWAPERLVVLGWEIFLSRRRQNGAIRWHLSAKLHPQGRSSTESDWKVVGQIAFRVGAPRDPLVVSKDPSAPVHWSWTEQ